MLAETGAEMGAKMERAEIGCSEIWCAKERFEGAGAWGQFPPGGKENL
jgi:hypothetical protein